MTQRRKLDRLPSVRRKALHLAVAYAGVVAVALSILLLRASTPGPKDGTDRDHLLDPCKGTFLPSQRHVSEHHFRKPRVTDRHYQEAVWEALSPGFRHVDRFAATKNWAAHAPQNSSAGTASSSIDVVLAIQCSPDRLPFVSAVTAHWKGPFALALYIPAPHGSPAGDECRDKVLDFVRDNSLKGADSYAVSLLYANGNVPNLHCDLSGDLTGFEQPYVNDDIFDRRFRGQPWTVLWNADYPVNELRTLARSMVRDDIFLFLSESDFMVPHDMHRKLTSGQHLRTLQSMRKAWAEDRERQAMIIPAFERLKGVPAAPDARDVCAKDTFAVKPSSTCFMYGNYDVPVTKPSLQAMTEANQTAFFYKLRFKVGHECYYPDDWLYSSDLYEITYKNPCEPYWLALAGTMPPFEPRFKGRMRDKVSIVSHMAVWGFHYLVNPELFVVHLPHNSVRTLASMSPDLTMYFNLWTAPYALAQAQLQNAALEPEFEGAITQAVPGLGDIEVPKPDSPVTAPSVEAPPEGLSEAAEERLEVERIVAQYERQPPDTWMQCETHRAAIWAFLLPVLLAFGAVTVAVMRLHGVPRPRDGASTSS